MPQYFPTESVFWALLRIVFWAAVVYAVMRTLWAIWEIPEKLRDIESRLGVLGKEIRDISGRLESGGVTKKESSEE